MNFAPRVLLPLADLEATKLIGWGSRVTYRLLVAGPDAAGERYRQWAVGEIERRHLRNTRVESLESGQPQMRATLDRAERFLSLVAVLSSMIAAVAIAMSARRYMQRHTDACAVYKCMGLSRAQILAAFGIEFLLLGAGGAVVGVAIGYAAHYGLLMSLGGLLQVSLPHPSIVPALVGVAAGLVLSTGVKLAQSQPRSVRALVVGVAAFLAIGWLRWPLLPVMAVLVPVALVLEYRAMRKGA